jgi:hypothetical protein
LLKKSVIPKSQILLLCIPFISIFYSIGCARQSAPFDPGAQLLEQLVVAQLNLGDPQAPEVIFNRSEGNGVTLTQVKAVSLENWTDYSFRTQSLRDSDLEWEIGFQRFKVRTNGGRTNSAGDGAACKGNTNDFGQVLATTKASDIGCPHANFEADRVATAEVIGGGGAEFIGSDVFTNFNSGWFTYRLPDLIPTLDVFVVRSGQGNRYYAVQITDYYSEAGTSGYPTFRWRQIQPPQ